MGREYDASDIREITLREAVRLRPGMWLGDKEENGLHQLIYRLLSNSIDEAIEGFGKKIQVIIHPDNSVTIADDGRGIPVTNHPTINRPIAESILTTLHAGSRFDSYLFKITTDFGGGAAFANFLSEWLRIEIKREGKLYQQDYQAGIPTNDLSIVGNATETGTKIHFKPDKTCFTVTEFNFEKLSDKFRQKACLNSGVEIVLVDERGGTAKELRFYSKNGLADFASFLCREKSPVHSRPIHFIGEIPETAISIEVAFLFLIQSEEQIVSFANHHPTPNGGKHVSGFYEGLTRAINQYVKTNYKKPALPTNKITDGMIAVLAVTLPEPSFEVSTRSSLRSEISGEVQSFVYQNLMSYFTANPEVASKIINHLWQEN